MNRVYINVEQVEEKEMKLSIILPVYNVEDYLEKCIESLYNQKSNDVEFIFVDDGSKDNSLTILENAALKDQRFQVYSKKNEGSGYARNYGLSKSSGEYIYFMDPDDWIERNFVETIFSHKKKVDMIIFGYAVYRGSYKKNTVGSSISLYIEEKKLTGDSFEKMFESATLFQVWNKVYRRDFLLESNLYFTNQKTGQDALFNIEVIKKVKTAIVLTDILYNYNARRYGSAQTEFNINKMKDNLNIAEQYINLYDYFAVDSMKPKEYLIEIFFEDIQNRVKHEVKPYWISKEFKKIIYNINFRDIQNRNSKIKLAMLKYLPKQFFKLF